MKLEHCKIEPLGLGETSRVNVEFSIPGPLTVGLVQEVGRRIENFLMPLHLPADAPVVEVKPWGEGLHENYISPEHVRGEPKSETYSWVETAAPAADPIPQPEPVAEDNLETIESIPEPVAEVKPAIRRNRGKMLPPVEVPSAPVAGTPLRVRGKPVAVLYADTEPVGETPAAEPAPAPAPRRTRTPAPEAEPEITDIELAKAASEAAAVIPLDEVKAIIAAMGVTTVNQIEGQEKRKEFLDVLRDAVLTEIRSQ